MCSIYASHMYGCEIQRVYDTHTHTQCDTHTHTHTHKQTHTHTHTAHTHTHTLTHTHTALTHYIWQLKECRGAGVQGCRGEGGEGGEAATDLGLDALWQLAALTVTALTVSLDPAF